MANKNKDSGSAAVVSRTFYLPSEVDEKLRRRAFREKTSNNTLMHRAVVNELNYQPKSFDVIKESQFNDRKNLMVLNTVSLPVDLDNKLRAKTFQAKVAKETFFRQAIFRELQSDPAFGEEGNSIAPRKRVSRKRSKPSV